MKQSHSEFVTLRGIRTHVRRWGSVDAPRLVMLHGWMDVSATFQFLVDAFSHDWQVIAPDWRGFGQTEWNHHSYWFPDYVADLDALLRLYSPELPSRLVGHSLGGNAACLYAGIRPERVAAVVTLEGFGLHVVDSKEAPARYAEWLDQVLAGPSYNRYGNRAELAVRLQSVNPRLTPERAAFLSEYLGEERSQDPGKFVVAADPYHKLTSPILYRLDDAKACWRNVTAPVLWVAARDSFIMKHYAGSAGEAEYQARIGCFRDIRAVMLEDAGHNMHHDQPGAVAALIEEFFS